MSRICDICSKKPMVGHSVSHSKRATKRRFLPNLQRRKLMINGKMTQVKICAKCLKTREKIK